MFFLDSLSRKNHGDAAVAVHWACLGGGTHATNAAPALGEGLGVYGRCVCHRVCKVLGDGLGSGHQNCVSGSHLHVHDIALSTTLHSALACSKRMLALTEEPGSGSSLVNG